MSSTVKKKSIPRKSQSQEEVDIVMNAEDLENVSRRNSLTASSVTSAKSLDWASPLERKEERQSKATEKVLKWRSFVPPMADVENYAFKRAPQDNEPSIRQSQWSFNSDFIAHCLTELLGLGNLFRFPYLCCKNGGAVFFIPYTISVIILGIPLFLAEMTAGQYADEFKNCWKFCPALRGIGILFFFVHIYSTLYYVMEMAWAFMYLYYCFLKDLPWSRCKGPWATALCEEYLLFVNFSDCTGKLRTFRNGTCYDIKTERLVGIYNRTIAAMYGIYEKLPAEDFLKYSSLKFGLSPGLHDIGSIQWQICLALALLWLLIFTFQFQKLKRISKCVYFFVTFPIIGMLLLLLKALTLEGSRHGINFYLHLDTSYLLTTSIWYDAAVQVVFSLSLALNALPYLSSKNSVQYNIVRDTFILIFVDSFISFFAGLVVFSSAGALAMKTSLKIQEILTSSYKIGLVVFPQLFTYQSAPNFWCIVLFLTIVTIGSMSRIIAVETITANLLAYFNISDKFRYGLSGVVIISMYLIQLPMATPGGVYLVNLLAYFGFGWNAVFGLLLMSCAMKLYGIKKFCHIIQLMVGDRPVCFIPWKFMQWYFVVCWTVLTPMFLMVIMVLYFINFRHMVYESYAFPLWVTLIGTVLTFTSILAPFLVIFTDVVLVNCNIGKVLQLIEPHPAWQTNHPDPKCKPRSDGTSQISLDFQPIVDFYTSHEDITVSSNRHPGSFVSGYSSLPQYKTRYPLSDTTHEENADDDNTLSQISMPTHSPPMQGLLPTDYEIKRTITDRENATCTVPESTTHMGAAKRASQRLKDITNPCLRKRSSSTRKTVAAKTLQKKESIPEKLLSLKKQNSIDRPDLSPPKRDSLLKKQSTSSVKDLSPRELSLISKRYSSQQKSSATLKRISIQERLSIGSKTDSIQKKLSATLKRLSAKKQPSTSLGRVSTQKKLSPSIPGVQRTKSSTTKTVPRRELLKRDSTSKEQIVLMSNETAGRQSPAKLKRVSPLKQLSTAFQRPSAKKKPPTA